MESLNYYFLTGLDNLDIANPRQVYELLCFEVYSTNLGNNSNELLSLEGPLRRKSCELPKLIYHEQKDGRRFKETFGCLCEPLSIDEQRSRYVEKRKFLQEKRELNINADKTLSLGGEDKQDKLDDKDKQDENDDDKENDDNEEEILLNFGDAKGPLDRIVLRELFGDEISQLRLFKPLTRNKLARQIKLARRINQKRGNFSLRLDHVALYKFEQMIREVNTNLAYNLSALSRKSGQNLTRLAKILVNVKSEFNDSASGEYNSLEMSLNKWLNSRDHSSGQVMIRAPILEKEDSILVEFNGRRCLRRTIRDNITFANMKNLHKIRSDDSGIGELPQIVTEDDLNCRFKFVNCVEKLERMLLFKSNKRVQAIVQFSINFFDKLLKESTLFTDLLKPCQSEAKTTRLVTKARSDSNKIDEETKPSLQNGLESNSFRSNLMDSQEFKLQACVECQHLRSALTFKWLTGCLMLAFSHFSSSEKAKPDECLLSVETDKFTEDFSEEAKLRKEEEETRENFPASLPELLLGNEASNLEISRIAELENMFCNSGNDPPRKEGTKMKQDKNKPTVGNNGGAGFFLASQEEQMERELLKRLALLMSILLRQHLLEPALERMFSLFANHQLYCFLPDIANQSLPNSTHKRLVLKEENLFEEASKSRLNFERKTSKTMEAKLTIQVELKEIEGGLMFASQPQEELKATLGFVVDELVSVCQRLPRLDCQLSCLRNRIYPPGSEDKDICEENKELFLEVNADELVAKTKSKIAALIDNSCSLDSYMKQMNNELFSKDLASKDTAGGKMEIKSEINWLNSSYLEALELVNKIRSGEWSNLEEKQEISETELNVETDDRLRQLKLSYKQIDLLNLVEFKLNRGQLDRYVHFGFILLDYEPLREGLLKNLQKERLLLTRIELDNLLKLMERLRLQFDEIELGIDLESAIEDYLAEKWQAKQQQPAAPSQAVILSAADLDDELDELTMVEQATESIFINRSSREDDMEVLESGLVECSQNLAEKRLLISQDEEELVTALMGLNQKDKQVSNLTSVNNLNNVSTETSKDEGEANELLRLQREHSERQVAPLIESQLLVNKFEYFSKLLENELKPLTADLELVFEGCIFLSEYVAGSDCLLDCRTSNGDSCMEIFQELSNRSQEFNQILWHSYEALESARGRLYKLNQFRSFVLSKLLLEFHQLVRILGLRKLAEQDTTNLNGSNEAAAGGGGGGGQSAKVNVKIRQLDSYQETSDFAQKLLNRYTFIDHQNSLLAKEITLLTNAKLNPPKLYQIYLKLSSEFGRLAESRDDSLEDQEHLARLKASTESRQKVLSKWQGFVSLLANFWELTEDFETQQVKWLNLDTKRINYRLIEETFASYSFKLDTLLKQTSSLTRPNNINTSFLDNNQVESMFIETLLVNLNELSRRFKAFSRQKLPIFKFLTNKHLTQAHWQKLNTLLSQISIKSKANGKSAKQIISPQNCTTLAQFLELNEDVEEIVDQLELMNKQTLLEYELTEFLLAEEDQKNNKYQLDISEWLENWTELNLEMAASRFLSVKLKHFINVNESLIASRKLVAIHGLVKRYLKLKYNCLDLVSNSVNYCPKQINYSTKDHKEILLENKSPSKLTSVNLLRMSLFVEFLRVFSKFFIRKRHKLNNKMKLVAKNLKSIQKHLGDIDTQIERVQHLYTTDLVDAEHETEVMLVKLEKETVKLELDRELLAAKEAMALELQREALNKRDQCIREITERAIPAIRAASKALDCLDEKSLRTLRSIRPKPPEPVRLVIEGVCLLRAGCISSSSSSSSSSSQGLDSLRLMAPERRFDALQGKMVEDYWPAAYKQLNGTHSQRFLTDLRLVATKKSSAATSDLMRLIRRKYLSHSSFKVSTIERVSLESSHLARWLIAVDVFDRVINVVRPNYKSYLESENQLAESLRKVNESRREIEIISRELRQMEDSLDAKINQKSSLVDSLEDCRLKLTQVESIRLDLIYKREAALRQLKFLSNHNQQLLDICLASAAKSIYIASLVKEDQISVMKLIKELIF